MTCLQSQAIIIIVDKQLTQIISYSFKPEVHMSTLQVFCYVICKQVRDIGFILFQRDWEGCHPPGSISTWVYMVELEDDWFYVLAIPQMHILNFFGR